MTEKAMDKFLEKLHDVFRKLSREIKRMMELEEEAKAVLGNLEKVLERVVEEEVKDVRVNKQVRYTFRTSNLDMKIYIDEDFEDVVMSASDPSEEFSEPLTPPSLRYLYTLLAFHEEGRDLIEEIEKRIEKWKERNEEWAKILKALKNALAPFILEDL